MKPTPELIKLVDKSLAKNIARVEMARLEELLENDDFLRYYLEIAGVEGNIPLALEAGVEMAPSLHFQNPFTRWVRPLGIAAAALVLFSVGLYSGKKIFSPPSAGDIAGGTAAHRSTGNGAAITSLIGVTWEGEAPDSIKISEHSKTLAIKSGLLELTFDSGVRSLIEGPAMIKVTGGNSAELNTGRLVANVPRGAEGFTVEYPDGKVVDLDTEFALNVPQNREGAEIGVFRGEVEVYDSKQNTPLKILENHAMVQISGSRNPFASIPFQREDYIRELPSREFPWKLPKEPSTSTRMLEFDVSHLVWKSGDYRAVFKHMKGADALAISKAELLLDGKPVSTDTHFGRTGQFDRTINNTYTFNVPEGQNKKGTWTLRITAEPDEVPGIPLDSHHPDSSGILLFEDSHSTRATDDSFVGTWEYRHDGNIHRRVFTADHRVQYFFNGKKLTLYDQATWTVEDGILTLVIPPNGDVSVTTIEKHLLRSDEELTFINQPYRNAIKVK